jgi:hypothetical protein
MSRFFLAPGYLTVVNRGCFCAIVFYTMWYTVGFQIRHQSLTSQDLLDYALNYERSRLVMEQLAYPPWSSGFLYPPPNIVLRLTLGDLGLQVSGVLWMVLLMGATLACIEFALSLMRLSHHPAKYVLALSALSAVEYFFEWDLKYLNGNVLYLASLLGSLVLIKQRKAVHAGFWLAASMVFKVYSVVFLPYFLLTRQYDLCLATLVWLAFFFLAVPMAYFGAEHATTLTETWVRTVLSSGQSMNVPLELAAYVMSWHKTLLILLNSTAGKGIYNVLNLSQEQVLALTRGTQVLWALLVVVYFWVSVKRSHVAEDSRTLLLDAGALTLFVLPFSPALQPHHGVVMLISAMALIGVASDPCQSTALRWSAACIVLTCYIELQFGPSLMLRGVGMMATTLLFMAGLILVRARLRASEGMESCVLPPRRHKNRFFSGIMAEEYRRYSADS